MENLNETSGLDFDTAGGSESPYAGTASNGVAGLAAADFSTPKEVSLLDKWFFMQKVVSDPRLGRCAVACAFHLVDYYHDRLGRAWPSYETLARRSWRSGPIA